MMPQAPVSSHLSAVVSESSCFEVPMALIEREILPYVDKPGRYLGLEQGTLQKPWGSTKANMVLAFPDLYEIGMSSYAIKLLYSVVNGHADYYCDRVYAPALDFKAKLAEHALPLYAVESKRPLQAFDMVAVSLQYELNYTTALGLLDAARFPLAQADRLHQAFPVVLAGGPGATHPAPLSPYFDGFLIGDGEDLLIEVMDTITKHKETYGSAYAEKDLLLQALAALDGVYIPTHSTGIIYKRLVDIATQQVELAPLIPSVEAVHDRVVVEARRGCDRMCRFCQPCFINLPVREQHIDKIRDSALKELHKTGYEECSLLSLSIADYSQLTTLVKEVSGAIKKEGASLSLPSQRADRFSVQVAEEVQSVRKSTLTFAPEAGTPRLRDVINKNLSDAEIQQAVTTAYRAGWGKVKLYFMIGLPTETYDDLDGIIQIVKKLQWLCDQIRQEPAFKGRTRLEVNVTISNFVPKPHTPFQWCAQDSLEMLAEKISYLKEHFVKFKGVKINYTDPEISKMECVITKADASFAPVLRYAYENGAYLDAWDMTTNADKWLEAMAKVGVDPEYYTRERLLDLNETLPWDMIDVGVDKPWLQEEYRRAMEAASTVPCFDACSSCGVCGKFLTWPSFSRDIQSADKPNHTDAAPWLTQAHLAPVASSSESEAVLTDATETPLPERTRLEALKVLPKHRVRLKLAKLGHQRFLSHLDWMRGLQRAAVRANLPIAYSLGFNPKPKMGFSPALPLFAESEGEWVDLDLAHAYEASEVQARLNQFLLEEGRVLEAFEVPLETPSVDGSLLSMTYSLKVACEKVGSHAMIEETLKHFMSQASWYVTLSMKLATPEKKQRRGGKQPTSLQDVTLDLKPHIQDFSFSFLSSSSSSSQDDMLVISFSIEKSLVLRYSSETSAWIASHVCDTDPALIDRSQGQGTKWIKPDWMMTLLHSLFALVLDGTLTPEASQDGLPSAVRAEALASQSSTHASDSLTVPHCTIAPERVIPWRLTRVALQLPPLSLTSQRSQPAKVLV
ncbi:MAG: TIGR03960 family B12-binding radical SAM protein [Vampirovibrionales bacterium]